MPAQTITAYKLFRTKKTAPGQLFPLFIGKTKPVPQNEWIEAEFIPTKGFAQRPGWHAGRLPQAEHLKRKDGTFAPDRVWAEVEIPADIDWQSVADTETTGDIRHRIPANGYYRFKRPANQGGEWIIGGALKVNRVLTIDEVEALNN